MRNCNLYPLAAIPVVVLSGIVRNLLPLAVLLLLVGCSAPDSARDALTKQGFRDIRILGWAPLSCSQDDLTSTGFTAVNPQGLQVEGVVCCGILKSCTVRW